VPFLIHRDPVVNRMAEPGEMKLVKKVVETGYVPNREYKEITLFECAQFLPCFKKDNIILLHCHGEFTTGGFTTWRVYHLTKNLIIYYAD